eukprot:10626632-Heterocapsa_arctica.AAC.1
MLIIGERLDECGPWRGVWQATNKDQHIACMAFLNLFGRLSPNGRSFLLLMVLMEGVMLLKFGKDILCSSTTFGWLLACYTTATAH